MVLNDEEKEKLDYFQKHALPWQMEHIRLRASGLQFFIPIQAFLFLVWNNTRMPIIAWFGIASCISLFLWDERTRFIIGTVHKWGREIADKHFFAVDKNGKPIDGVHVIFGKTLSDSGKVFPKFSALKSHTTAIRLLINIAIILWLLILFRAVSPMS